jgi:hypothetical protein
MGSGQLAKQLAFKAWPSVCIRTAPSRSVRKIQPLPELHARMAVRFSVPEEIPQKTLPALFVPGGNAQTGCHLLQPAESGRGRFAPQQQL